jgi:hypothetical protein
MAEAAAMAEAADMADDSAQADPAEEGLATAAKPGTTQDAEPAEGGEAAEAQEAPRWAAPAVPPPPTGAGKPARGSTGRTRRATPRRAAAKADKAAGPVAAPVTAPAPPAVAPTAPRKPLLSQKWINTLAVTAVIAAVVLGGLGLDAVLAAPSVGEVDLGDGVTMTAAPGWIEDSEATGFGVQLQKGSVALWAGAERSSASLSQVLEDEMDGLRSAASEVAFGPVQSGYIGRHEARLVVFTAILDWGTADGEIVCLGVAGRVVIVDVWAPQGYLDAAEDDISTMIESIEVSG